MTKMRVTWGPGVCSCNMSRNRDFEESLIPVPDSASVRHVGSSSDGKHGWETQMVQITPDTVLQGVVLVPKLFFFYLKPTYFFADAVPNLHQHAMQKPHVSTSASTKSAHGTLLSHTTS